MKKKLKINGQDIWAIVAVLVLISMHGIVFMVNFWLGFVFAAITVCRVVFNVFIK